MCCSSEISGGIAMILNFASLVAKMNSEKYIKTWTSDGPVTED